MPEDAKRKARTEVQRAQSKFARVDSQRDHARIARRQAFEHAREAGLTLREIGETIGLRWEHLDLGESPKVKVREQLYKGNRKRLKSKDGKRDVPFPLAWLSGS